MLNVKKILFPVDLSEFASKIVPDVIATARAHKADVELLFVSATLDQFATFYIPHPSLNTLTEELHTAGERKLKEFEEEHFADYPHTTRVVLRGDPAAEILKYLDSGNIDLVIMATHGRKGLDRTLFGSVAEKVVKGSPIPVLSINPYKKA